MEGLILEVINPLGRVIKRQKVKSEEITVGRGYENDLIVSDKYVDSEHLVIRKEESGWTAYDLDSENGLYKKGDKHDYDKVCLSDDDIFIIGKTRIRVRFPDHEVSSSLKISQPRSRLKRILYYCFAWFVLLMVPVSACFFNFFEKSSEIELTRIFAANLMDIFIPLVWAGVWSFVERTLKNRWSFHFQLIISSVFIIALNFIIASSTYVEFWTSSLKAGLGFKYIVIPLAGSILLYWNIRTASSLSNKKSFIISNSVVWTLTFIILFVMLALEPDFVHFPRFSRELKPPAFNVRTPVTKKEFFSQNEKMFEKLDVNDAESEKQNGHNNKQEDSDGKHNSSGGEFQN